MSLETFNTCKILSGNIESMKIFSLETYWIHTEKFESGNELNTCQKFWVWKLIEYMAKILSGNIESMAKILSLETYWIQWSKFWVWKLSAWFSISFQTQNFRGKNFESGNLLNTWLKFWECNIEYMGKNFQWKHWIHSKNFGSGNLLN